MKLTFGIAVAALVIALTIVVYCCLKVASDADDQMGYDDVMDDKE